DLRKRELGSNFISDNAATSHILSNRKDFYSYKEIDKSIHWGNASQLNIKGIGNSYIRCRDTGKKRLLKNVLYVPELGINIISQCKMKNHLSIINSYNYSFYRYQDRRVANEGRNNKRFILPPNP